MPYAQTSDVRGLIPHVQISTDSLPSEGTVAGWIADAEAILDAILASIGYAIPVTGPNAVRVIKTYIAAAVAAMVTRTIPDSPYDPEGFQKRYDEWIAALRKPFGIGGILLPDDAVRVTVVVDTGAVIRFSSSALDELEDEPRVSRDQVF